MTVPVVVERIEKDFGASVLLALLALTTLLAMNFLKRKEDA